MVFVLIVSGNKLDVLTFFTLSTLRYISEPTSKEKKEKSLKKNTCFLLVVNTRREQTQRRTRDNVHDSVVPWQLRQAGCGSFPCFVRYGSSEVLSKQQ